MNNLIDSVIAFQDSLKKQGIPVMAIGGIAVAVWGEPRLTRDIDMKVLVSREGVEVWLDKEKLLPGADWELEIRKAVRVY
jgi:hypothetical protein